MADGEQAFHQKVAQKIWNRVMETNVFVRNERFPKEIFEILYGEYGGRLAKTVGEGTGETCSGCGRANTWHPECPICRQLTKLEARVGEAQKALQFYTEDDDHTGKIATDALAKMKEIDNG